MENIGKPPRKAFPKAFQVFVFRRDHWRCHLCRRPVVFAPALKYLQQYLQRELAQECPDLSYWRYAYTREFAPLLDELAAVIDHVNPHVRGGPGNEANLKTACNKCNSRKNDHDYAKWVRDNPIRKNKVKNP